MHPIQAASLTLERVMSSRGSLSSLMPEFSDRVPKDQLPKYKELCFGSCRWYFRIQSCIDRLVERPIKKNEVRVRALLTVALYDLMENSNKDYAVVNAAVDAARKLNKPWAKGLINALLRGYLRGQGKPDWDDACYLHAHGPWLLQKIQDLYPDDWQQIVKANNRRPPLCLRVNLRKIQRDNYLALLGDQNIGAHPSPDIPSVVYLTTPTAVQAIPGFRDGLVSVQDEGAQLAGYLLDLAKKQRILDACSAPGGKAGQILELQPSIHLIALELEEGKLGLITSNMARLGVFAHLQQGDATTLDWWDGRSFHSIVVDAPCSCSGVLRRHPDIKVMLNQSQVDKNRTIQSAILCQLWQTLAPNGRLLYSTCSIFPEENEQIVEAFTITHGDAAVQPIELPQSIAHRKTANGVQLLPTASAGDGFYYSLIEKTP